MKPLKIFLPKKRPEEMKSMSIVLRLRRVTYEDAYVAVPVTSAIMDKVADENGDHHVNIDAMWTEAIRLGNDQRADWKIESVQVEPHETQLPKPEDRKLLDGFHDFHSKP